MPSCTINGLANCSKVSDRISTCVRSRNSSRNWRAPGKRFEPGDHVGDQRHRQVVLGEQLESTAHQCVVVGLVTGGATQLGYARALGDCDPDLRNQHTLEVERHDRLTVWHRRTVWTIRRRRCQ